MPTEQDLKETYIYILDRVVCKDISAIIYKLRQLIGQLPQTEQAEEFLARLNQIETPYRYMLEYALNGVEDPQRETIGNQILSQLRTLFDEIYQRLYEEVGKSYIWVEKRLARKLQKTYNLNKMRYVLEAYSDALQVAQLTGDVQSPSFMQTAASHEQTYHELFHCILTSSQWNREQQAAATAILQSEAVCMEDKCLLVSALMLSLCNYFDPMKYALLAEACKVEDKTVCIRAVVGIIVTSSIHAYPLELDAESRHRLEFLFDEERIVKIGQRVFSTILFSSKTHSLEKEMQEEVLPGVIDKLKSNLRSMESPDDEDAEIPSLSKEEEEQIFGHMIKMTELQKQGADIYWGTFRKTKGLDFFKSPANWLYPFTPYHPQINHILGKEKSKKTPIDIILTSGMLCESDKYSLVHLLKQLPEDMREAMLKNMILNQDDIDEVAETKAYLKKEAQSDEVIIDNYIHDLYRFCMIDSRMGGDVKIFDKDSVNRLFCEVLAPIYRHADFQYTVAQFFIRQKEYASAYDLLRRNTDKDTNPLLFEKYCGYCLLKMKDYENAIKCYLAADIIKPDELTTLHQLGRCYKYIHNYSEAATYYKRVLELKPDNIKLLYQYAHILTQNKDYAEALQVFFKLNYLEPDQPRNWRGIAWLSLILDKMDTAHDYLEKLLKCPNPDKQDFLNAGNWFLIKGRLNEAVEQYVKAARLMDHATDFSNEFHKEIYGELNDKIDITAETHHLIVEAVVLKALDD